MQKKKNLVEYQGQKPTTFCLSINHPGEGLKNERLKNREMCDERKSEKMAFSEKKIELEGRVT